MQDDATGIEAGTRLPSRVVVSIPTLEVLALDDGSASDPGVASSPVGDTAPTTVHRLFTAAAQSVIEDEIVPTMLRNQVWSGELACSPSAGPDDEPQTALTLWVPHQEPHGPASAATVLIGAALSTDRGRVAPDPLTGLPTRVVLLDRLDLARRRSRRNGDLMAALFIDMDGLKAVNDRLGHEEGDTVLRLAAQRIRTALRDGDTVARFGGDEFVVLCESIDEESQAERVADRIIERLGEDPGLMPMSASIGIAYDRGAQLNPLELIGRADAAMYRAKEAGGSRYEVFDSELQGRMAADESLRERLRRAISADGLDVASQPLFELQTGRVLGVELFIRLAENGNPVTGSDVLRLAREQAEAIDAAMLGRATAIARNWRDDLGADAPRIHLNVSAQSLTSGQFLPRVRETLDRHRLDPARFAFEVDSSDFVPLDQRAIATMRSLKQLGARLVIDGYGVGSASLRMIDRVRPDLVKVASYDPGRARALEPAVIVGLVRSVSTLGVGTCVKGIESPALLDRVAEAGAFAGQGIALAPVTSLEAARPHLEPMARIGF